VKQSSEVVKMNPLAASNGIGMFQKRIINNDLEAISQS
jgi:hypothetical protein